MQSKRVLPPQRQGEPPPPMASFGPASSFLSPTVRDPGIVGDQCSLRQPRLAGNAAPAPSSAPSPPPEGIPCDAPVVADLIRTGAVPVPELVFRGWRKPAEEWKAWVEAMAREDKFVRLWRAAGIKGAIFNSIVNIRQAGAVVLALVGFWCRLTSTFVLPWGEVGFTLEGAHVLGNLPVWGAPLQRLLTEEEERLRLRLVEVREMLWGMMKKSGRRARVTHSRWLNWFVKLEGDDELLHLGFLVYWLSKFVVPCKPSDEVPAVVFEIAARLSRGERIALAPAVTANLYSDLSTITKLLYDSKGGKGGIKIDVWAQFRLLQVWLWERFDCLGPKEQNSINRHSRVRIARWDKKQNQLTYYEALEAFYDPRSFVWRPYIDELENWVKPKWYMREERSIVVDEHSPSWVYDVLTILSASGLIGLAREDIIPMGQYKPYRVSMQLGYDQAIPTSSCPLVVPWDSSTMCPTGIEFYVPSTMRKCSTLTGYIEWWEDYNVSYEVVLKVSGIDLKEKKSNKRKMSNANHSDDSKKLSMDGNTKKSRLPGDVKVENERVHREGEANFAENPKNSSRHPVIEVLDDEDPDVIIIENEQREDMNKKYQKHHHRSHKGDEDESDFDDVLVDELEEFLTQGLQAELLSNVSSPSFSVSEKSAEHDHKNATDATEAGDHIGEEVIRKYPKLFSMIPQYPHYIGLLRSNVDVGNKKAVYTSLWYKLVKLMQKAMRTTCQTKASEIEQLTKEAWSLEKLGFDVRHLIARLKQPDKRLKKLESAKIALEKARKSVKEAEKQSSLENIGRTRVSDLWKAVTKAEINVLDREWDVEILGKCLNSK